MIAIGTVFYVQYTLMQNKRSSLFRYWQRLTYCEQKKPLTEPNMTDASPKLLGIAWDLYKVDKSKQKIMHQIVFKWITEDSSQRREGEEIVRKLQSE